MSDSKICGVLANKCMAYISTEVRSLNLSSYNTNLDLFPPHSIGVFLTLHLRPRDTWPSSWTYHESSLVIPKIRRHAQGVP